MLSTAPAKKNSDAKFFHDPSVWTRERLAVKLLVVIFWIRLKAFPVPL